jgi:phosphohistidine swiveling domain-containing protein
VAGPTADFVRVREDRAYWQLETSGCVRALLLRVGAALAADGRLTRPADVLYLYTHELRGDAARWPALVERRRRQVGHWATLLPPPSLGGPSRRAAEGAAVAPPPDDARVLRGTAASAGVVTGVARVIRGPEEADRVSRGDIVVCRTTVPAWSPLLAIAGGVVANAGSVLGHTAILARELAIPCVVDAKDATTRIQDGDLLRVDGGAGEVHILDAGSTPSG